MGNNMFQSPKQIESSKTFFSQCLKLSKEKYFKELKFQNTIKNNNKGIVLGENQKRGIIFVPHVLYYEGFIVDGEAEGEGKMRWAEGGLQIYEWPCYCGQFSKGKASGEGIFQSNIYDFKGTWENGKPLKGTLTVKFAKKEQSKQYQIENLSFYSKQNCIKAKADIKLPDKSQYSGEIEKFGNTYLFHGFGSMKFSNGDQYVGQWKTGQMNGEGKYKWRKSKRVYSGIYKDGVRMEKEKF